MALVLAITVGVLVAGAVHLMLSRDLVRFLFGLILISNAANLVIFGAGGLTWGAPPLIAEGAQAPAGDVANALPQALVLTAIVIGFGLLLFALILVWRAYDRTQSIDSDAVDPSETAEDETRAVDAADAAPATRGARPAEAAQ